MPRLRYRCTLPQTRDCHKDQYINSAHYYKRLLPIWETHKNYAILREAHPEYERIHNHNRHRYRISPDCLELRPKRNRRRLATTARLSPPSSNGSASASTRAGSAKAATRTPPTHLPTRPRANPQSSRTPRQMRRLDRPTPIPRRPRTTTNSGHPTPGSQGDPPTPARPDRG